MAPSGTRVPPSRLSLALDRMQATHAEYTRHIKACPKAEAGRWTDCLECVWLDRDADAAAHWYGLLNDPLRRGHLTVVV